jgi:hypothetical protein
MANETHINKLPLPPRMPFSAILAEKELQAKYDEGTSSTGIAPSDAETVRPPKKC